MRKITDQDIYRMLLGNVVIGNLYNSPIPGRKDKTPSFALFEKNGVVLWRDHGLPDQFGDKASNLYQHMRGFPLTHAGWHRANEALEQEFRVGLIGVPPTQLRSKPKHDRPPCVMGDTFKDFEIGFWNRFDFTVPELLYEDIEPLRKMSWTEGGEMVFESTPSEPAFIYWWNKSPASYKIYRPLSQKRDKFRQWNVDGIIEGWNSLIKEYERRNRVPFDILFNGSSTKDRMVLKKASGPNCSGFNPRGEGDFKDIVAKAPIIKSMAKRVVCLYDADDAGFAGASRMAELTGFEFYDTRAKLFGHKDFADMKDKTRGNMSYQDINNTILNLIQ